MGVIVESILIGSIIGTISGLINVLIISTLNKKYITRQGKNNGINL